MFLFKSHFFRTFIRSNILNKFQDFQLKNKENKKYI